MLSYLLYGEVLKRLELVSVTEHQFIYISPLTKQLFGCHINVAVNLNNVEDRCK